MTSIFQAHFQLVDDLKKDPQKIYETLDLFKVDLLHMAIGISGEMAELAEYFDEGNLKEEIGDVFFYISGTLRILDTSWERFLAICSSKAQDKINSTLTGCIYSAGLYLDLVKKCVIYNQPIEDFEFLTTLADFFVAFMGFCLHFGITIEEAIGSNIIKLRKRHGNKYSDKSAIEKIDHKES